MQTRTSDKVSFRKLMRDIEQQRKSQKREGSRDTPRIFDIRFINGVSAYNYVWDDRDSGSDLTCSIYTPNVDPDWFSIGDMVSPISEYPSASTTVPLVLLKLIDPQSDALKSPVGFNLIYTDQGSGAPHDLSVWQPVPPPGYVALGYVVQPNYDQPVRPDFMCVKEDFVDAASCSFLFNDAGSGAHDDLGAWNVFGDASNTVLAGGFLAMPALTGAPPASSCFAIRADCVLLNGVPYETILEPVPVEPETASIDVKLLTGEGVLQFKWNDVGTGGSSATCDFFDVAPEQLPPEYFSLGSGGMLDSFDRSLWQLCVVKDVSGCNALAMPSGVTQIWADHGSGGDNDGSFWLMQPPTGYVALGIIAQNGYDAPDLSMYRCVRSDLVCDGSVLQNAAWNDVDTGADDDFSAWYLAGSSAAALQANLLAGYNRYTTFPDPVFMLNAAFCTGANGRFKIIDSTGALLSGLFEEVLLDLRQLDTTELNFAWSDAGSGADDDVLMYRLSDDLRSQGYLSLGYFGASNGTHVAPARVAKARPGYETLFQPPITFKSVWMDQIWQPIPPAGFVAMGVIACNGTPSTSSVWCVQQDLIIPGALGQRVWSDAGSGQDEDVELHLAMMDLEQFRDVVQDAPQTVGTMISVGMPTCVLRRVHCGGDVDEAPPPDTRAPAFKAQIALDYELVWSDSGSGGSNDASFFNPILPEGFYFLGSSGQPNYDGASVSALRSVIVSNIESGGMDDAFAPASDVVQLQTTGADITGTFWQPIPPEGYIALGMVVSSGDGKPDLTNYRCVKRELIRLGAKDAFVWNDEKTGADLDISIYSSKSMWGSLCCSPGTLASVPYYDSPVDFRAYTLCTAYIDGEMTLTPAEETALINTYGPQVTYHPDEEYLPLTIEDMLGRVSLSDGTTTITEVTRETLKDYPSWTMALKPGAATSGSAASALGYVHVQYGTLFTDFQFWTLHAYNGAGTVEVSSLLGDTSVTTVTQQVAPMGQHEGDWETVILRFANVTTGDLPPLVDVGFVSHGDLVWARAEDVHKSGLKVIAYSSLNGHGAYQDSGDNYTNEGKVAGLVRWRLVNKCSDSAQVLDLSQNFAIAARSYVNAPDSIVDAAWEYPGRWGAVAEDALDVRKFVPFVWKALWPTIIEVYLVLLALTMLVPFLGIPLFWATTAALIIAFIPNATNTLLPRVLADQAGPMPPPLQNPWKNL